MHVEICIHFHLIFTYINVSLSSLERSRSDEWLQTKTCKGWVTRNVSKARDWELVSTKVAADEKILLKVEKITDLDRPNNIHRLAVRDRIRRRHAAKLQTLDAILEFRLGFVRFFPEDIRIGALWGLNINFNIVVVLT